MKEEYRKYRRLLLVAAFCITWVFLQGMLLFITMIAVSFFTWSTDWVISPPLTGWLWWGYSIIAAAAVYKYVSILGS